MKLHVMSDLHLEFYPDGGDSFVAGLDPKGSDVLVLAGDITVARFFEQTLDLFRQFCDRYPRVVYVPGNHEYYRSQPAEVSHLLRCVEEVLKGRLFVLDSVSVLPLLGRRFLGDTMWFRDHPDNGLYAEQLSDFSLIKGFVPWVYEQNLCFERFLSRELREGDIVVTHHLPSLQSCSPAYRADGMEGLNRFFVCELDDLIQERKPQFWIHGHTHTDCDYRLGETRVVCNPLGYPRERVSFNRSLYIEV